MPFTVNRNHALPVIELRGKFLGSLDGYAFKGAIFKYKSVGTVNIVLDLSKTDFIDSSGIGVLVGALTAMREEGGDIRLAGLQKRTNAIFLMSRLLGSVFESFETVEQAISSFRREALA